MRQFVAEILSAVGNHEKIYPAGQRIFLQNRQEGETPVKGAGTRTEFFKKQKRL
jgi:hypothetical protein